MSLLPLRGHGRRPSHDEPVAVELWLDLETPDETLHALGRGDLIRNVSLHLRAQVRPFQACAACQFRHKRTITVSVSRSLVVRVFAQGDNLGLVLLVCHVPCNARSMLLRCKKRVYEADIAEAIQAWHKMKGPRASLRKALIK